MRFLRIPSWTVASIIFGLLILSPIPSLVAAQFPSPSLAQGMKESACLFLQELYVPSIGLIRNLVAYPQVYYIVSDNLLARIVLLDCNLSSPRIVQGINQSISSCCGQGYDGMHEVLDGVRVHLAIPTSITRVIANSSAGRLFRGVTPDSADGNYTMLWGDPQRHHHFSFRF